MNEARDPQMIIKTNPSTGEVIGEYRITTPEEVEAAVGRARRAFEGWSQLSVKERIDHLMRIKDVVKEEGEEIARRISEDTGKPLVDSLMTELLSIPLFLDYYKKTAHRTLKMKRVGTPLLFFPSRSYIQHFPMGVIAVISPWNFPFQLSMVPILSALIAGNTVVFKPSEVTPITGEIIANLFEKIRLPTGVVEVVQGDGSTGAALTDCDVDKIFFTGSVATGKKVMAAAAKKPIPVELELGGKDAMIVCHDAYLRRAARAAIWGGLLNAGQMCISVERIFVVESVYDEFLELLKKEVEHVKVGSPEEDADMGPLTFPKQIETVERHVRSALEAGAKVLFGGKRPERPGQFYEPTLVTDVTDEMEIYTEETFGPVLPVVKVASEEEAVEMANRHQYGLTGSVWTQDRRRGVKLAAQIESGQVCVNDLVISVGNPALPFGGVKNSGFGRYHGAEGLLSFTHQKAIMVNPSNGEAEPFWFPYHGKYEDFVDLFHALLKGNLVRALFAKARLSKRTVNRGSDD